jgi:hypothetical protein
MGLRGPKPKGNILTKWSRDLAYVVGLITTDGSLSKNGRVVDFTSKDKVLVEKVISILKSNSTIGSKLNGMKQESFRVQISDVVFYEFLLKIGLHPNKTKTLDSIAIPKKYFTDFLRGHFDGDGTSYSYFDKRWVNSFMFYVCFVSASKKHINWIQNTNQTLFGVCGYIKKVKNKDFYELRYAKKEGMVITHKMYYNAEVPCLKRKKDKLFLSIDKAAQVLKLVDKPA